jgi:hypothetical protein
MPLMDELQISLKDLMAAERPVRLIADRRGPVAIISDRLFARLRNYADSHHTPMSSVVEQLRDEIHRKMAW